MSNECVQIGFGKRYVEIVSINTRKFKNLNADGTRIEIKLNEPETDDIYQWMQQCFDELLHIIKIRLKIENQDRVGFSFNNMNESHAEFGISFRRFDQFNSNLILSYFKVTPIFF